MYNLFDKTAKIFNVSGVTLQLIGLLLLSRIDILGNRLIEAQSKVRDSALIEVYESAKSGSIHEKSTQELEVENLQSKANLNPKWFKFGLFFVVTGTTLQLIGSILGD
jgi:hypothetical protein